MNVAYPRLIKRIRAAYLDSVIITFLLLFSIVMVPQYIKANAALQVLFSVLLPFSYEPFLLSIWGSTIGHKTVGICVVSAASHKKLNIMQAFLRSFFKYGLHLCLFPIPLSTCFITRRHQAIHDLLCGTLVIYDPEVKVSGEGCLGERLIYDEQFNYPSLFRRLIVIISYIVLSFLLIGFLIAFFVSKECVMEKRHCSPEEVWIETAISLFWVLSIAVMIVLGWNSRLWGARRRLKDV